MAATPREALQRRGVAETKIAAGGGGGVATMEREEPYARAMEHLEMTRAMEIEDAASAEIGARRAAANLEKMKAEAATAELSMRLQELALQSRGGGGNEIMLAVVEMLKSDKAALIEQNKELAGQVGQIQQQIAAGLRADVGAAETPDAISAAVKNIAEFKGLLEAVKSMLPEPAAPVAATPVTNIHDQIALMKAEAEIKRSNMDADEAHARRMAEWNLQLRRADYDMERDREKNETDKKRVDTLASTLERGAPALISLLTDVGRSRFAPGAAPPNAGQPMSAPMIHVKCDAVDGAGQTCGAEFMWPADQESVVCPSCHVLSKLVTPAQA